MVNKNRKKTLFAEVYDRESDAVFRYCLIRTSDRDMALDFTQDTFMRFWKSLQTGKEINNCRTFLFTIARNIVIDWYRKKKSISLEMIMEGYTDSGPGFQAVASEDVEKEVEAEYLISKIRELPEPYGNAVYLRCVEELKPRQIAEILGESANVISVRISRGLQQLRNLLDVENEKSKQMHVG